MIFGAERLGQRQRAAAESAALIGEGEFGALAREHAGDAPGDRAVVGDAHDEAALARHQGAWLCDIEIRHGEPRIAYQKYVREPETSRPRAYKLASLIDRLSLRKTSQQPRTVR